MTTEALSLKLSLQAGQFTHRSGERRMWLVGMDRTAAVPQRTFGDRGASGQTSTDVIQRNSEWTLRNLEADTVATVTLAIPPVEGVCAVRSNGAIR